MLSEQDITNVLTLLGAKELEIAKLRAELQHVNEKTGREIAELRGQITELSCKCKED